MVCGFPFVRASLFSARLDIAQFLNAQNLTFPFCFVSHAYTLFYICKKVYKKTLLVIATRYNAKRN